MSSNLIELKNEWRMSSFEKSWLALGGIMTFGVLFGSQIFYILNGTRWSLYFQMALTGFWLGFFIKQRRKHGKKQKAEEKDTEESKK